MKICFYGDFARSLNGNMPGGGELQLALLSQALAKGGHEVVIVDFETNEDFITDDGIKVYKVEGWNNGFRVIRSLTHRLPQLYRCLKAQKADVYYCRIRDFRHIFAFWAARKVGAKFILQMASDLDSMSTWMRLKEYKAANYGSIWSLVNSILIEAVYPWLVRKSDLLLVQHEGQKSYLLKRNIKSTVLLNVFDNDRIPVISSQVHNEFVYVGGIDKRKGIVEFLEIINKAPQHSFKVIGLPRDKKGRQIYNKLKTYSNVSLLGKLSHDETLFQIANSKALISTSFMEGFPNVFLEAWAFGIPVISLNVDPGNILEKEALGVVANGNIDKLLQAMDNNRNTEEFAKRAKNYVANNHALNANKIKEICGLFC
jgi:glycosyltransferase involved in cell wall biosynthesis